MTVSAFDPRRRQALGALAALAFGASAAVAQASTRAQREMQIHKVTELGLEIWVENEPPWEAELMPGPSLPRFVAQSPTDYYPPSVMTYVASPRALTAAESFESMAVSTIRRAAENYNLSASAWAALRPEPARYGVLEGFESTFDGIANGEQVSVRVFVGRAPGRFPVALQAYTLRGKIDHLREPVRRAWTSLKYLG